MAAGPPPVLAPLVTGVADLRARAERTATALDVLVWCPLLSPGGGLRLLLSLLPAVRRQPGIRSVRLAVPVGAVGPVAVDRLRQAGVAVLELAGRERDGVVQAQVDLDGDLPLRVRGTAEWRTATTRQLARGCDVVYVPWPHQDEPLEVDVPVVATYQDTTLIEYPEGIGLGRCEQERDLALAWLQRAATVVSSEATAANLARLVPGSPPVRRVVHHAISPDPLVRELEGEAEVPAGLPPRYVVFAGNIAVHKNLDHLLVAWSRFEHRADWPLVVFGHGTAALLPGGSAAGHWRADQLTGLVRRLGLGPGNGLHVLGYVPDGAVRPIIAGGAALVMASYTEGGGSFPAEEALSTGLPVLCADIPVMHEHLDRRSATTTWFDPASVDDILRAARTLVDRYDDLRASAERGRHDDRPSWDDVAAQYAEVFREVVAEAAASANTADHAAPT